VGSKYVLAEGRIKKLKKIFILSFEKYRHMKHGK
jgi:hypothetical protein